MASTSKRPVVPLVQRAKYVKVDDMQVELPQHVAERFEALHTLHDGWDSYGGRAPTERALDALSEILAIIAVTVPASDERMATMHVGPTSGGATIEWTVAERCLEVGISADGSLDVLRVEDDESDDGPTPMSAPGALTDHLRWLLR